MPSKRRRGQCSYYLRTDGYCSKLDKKCRYRARKSDCPHVGTKKKPIRVM